MSFALLGFTLGFVALALAVYAALRLLLRRQLEKDSDILSSAVVTRTGTLLALILALMFAHQMENYLSVSKMVNKEAAAIADAFFKSERYARGDAQEAADILENIAAYVRPCIFWVLTIASLAAFHRAVLYFLFAMTNPFTDVGTVNPVAIERLYQEDRARLSTITPDRAD